VSKGEIALIVLASLREFVKECEKWGIEKVSLDSLNTLLDRQNEYEAMWAQNDQPKETT
jgi:benzoyl-CoA reductase/2-hydroxyglutaryl-CoA dehydratase subunit BcrC/BadD/HgdB